MTKQEFLETMRLALNGRIDSGQVMDNLQYYEEYINTEIRKGATESDVLNRLGDPRLIARTIVETGGGTASEAGADFRDFGTQEEEYMPYGQSGQRQMRLLTRVPVWAWVLLALVIIVLVISAVFSILAAVLPILLPILVVVFLVKMFRDWIN